VYNNEVRLYAGGGWSFEEEGLKAMEREIKKLEHSKAGWVRASSWKRKKGAV
jgi:hypothetical protein